VGPQTFTSQVSGQALWRAKITKTEGKHKEEALTIRFVVNKPLGGWEQKKKRELKGKNNSTRKEENCPKKVAGRETPKGSLRLLIKSC